MTHTNITRALHDGIAAACRDAFVRLCALARAGQSPDPWPVWIRLSYDGVTPCAPFIGPEAPSAEWRDSGARIDGSMSERQMANYLRLHCGRWPLFTHPPRHL